MGRLMITLANRLSSSLFSSLQGRIPTPLKCRLPPDCACHRTIRVRGRDTHTSLPKVSMGQRRRVGSLPHRVRPPLHPRRGHVNCEMGRVPDHHMRPRHARTLFPSDIPGCAH